MEVHLYNGLLLFNNLSSEFFSFIIIDLDNTKNNEKDIILPPTSYFINNETVGNVVKKLNSWEKLFPKFIIPCDQKLQEFFWPLDPSTHPPTPSSPTHRR